MWTKEHSNLKKKTGNYLPIKYCKLFASVALWRTLWMLRANFRRTWQSCFERELQQERTCKQAKIIFKDVLYKSKISLRNRVHCYFNTCTCSFNLFLRKALTEALGGAGMAQWWERSPPTNVAQVRFPDPVSYVGWVCCWFSSLLREVFSGSSGFPLSSKGGPDGTNGSFWLVGDVMTGSGRGNRGPVGKRGSRIHTTGSHVFWKGKPLTSG